MANFILPTAFGTALIAAIAVLVSPHDDAPKTDPAPTDQTSKSMVWTILDTEQNQSCQISKQDRISKRTNLVTLDPTCAELSLDILAVQVWQEDEDGNVSLADGKGEIIAEFGLTENSGLISISGQTNRYKLSPNS